MITCISFNCHIKQLTLTADPSYKQFFRYMSQGSVTILESAYRVLSRSGLAFRAA